ncbi:hypothetical protein [Streptomyces europaeiscabiei]|uniref:hypothetical protein n=1 Tax=Streptomyces europaeiscabiei TaxID=146819 RepID=UPI0029BD7173|nr:hypothetical protein [Streptomyces europaeiscabiei]MDX2764456.1 hypothetical protein [Streptomyces europaeiscabiei]MDX3548352.1 hypothetical protein [Streptomyces europaeiscabiei]
MVVVLALTACAVLAGARSLLAVGEWIADAPPQVLQAVGAPPRSSASQAAPACGIDGSPTAGEGRRRCSGPGRGPVARRPPLPHRERRSASSGRGRQEPARSSQGQGQEDPSARRPGPLRRPGPGPAGRAGEDERDHVLIAAAGDRR